MKVAVFTHERDPKPDGSPRRPLVTAYIRDYSTSWRPAPCMHVVPTTSGEQAKRTAIKDHKARCLAKASAPQEPRA